MRMEYRRFEWDRTKARDNGKKHGIRFEHDAEVLADPHANHFHLNRPDPRGGENRCLILASHPAQRRLVLAVVWTVREDENKVGPVTRIISARKASRKERERYEQQVLPNPPEQRQ